MKLGERNSNWIDCDRAFLCAFTWLTGYQIGDAAEDTVEDLSRCVKILAFHHPGFTSLVLRQFRFMLFAIPLHPHRCGPSWCRDLPQPRSGLSCRWPAGRSRRPWPMTVGLALDGD